MKRFLCAFFLLLLGSGGAFAGNLGEMAASVNQVYGGRGVDVVACAIETSDGCIVIAGRAGSDDGDVSKAWQGRDLWVLKIDPKKIMGPDKGIVLSRTYGGSGEDAAAAVIETSDGCIVVAGETDSDDGDISRAYGKKDVWLLKIDPAKTSESGRGIVFSRTYGGSGEDAAAAVIETSDGCLTLACTTESDNSGDVPEKAGRGDIWLLKIDPAKVSESGRGIVLSQTYGGSGEESSVALMELSDGCLIVGGDAWSKDGDVPGCRGMCDLWLLKIDPRKVSEPGKGIVFSATYGGSDFDNMNCLAETSDGCFLVVGSTDSCDGDVPGIYGGFDVWLLKIDPERILEPDRGIVLNQTYGGNDSDNANGLMQLSDGCLMLAGNSGSNRDGQDSGHVPPTRSSADGWLLKIDLKKTMDRNQGIVFSKTFGGTDRDDFEAILPCSGGGFFLIGNTFSGGSGDAPSTGGLCSVWLLKVDENGDF